MSDPRLPERIHLALDRDGLTLTGLRRRDLHIPSEEERLNDEALIRDAARRFASLTSPETIEKAASVAFHTHWDENTVWTELFEDEEPEIQAHWRKVAEAVLRSVEEGTQ